MYGSFYRALEAHLMTLPILALVVFLLVFAIVVARTLAHPAAEIAEAARLPLDDGGDR